MGLFGKGNTMNMIHFEGLPGFENNYATAMTLDEEKMCLRFVARAFKNVPEIELPLNKITNAGNVNVTEIEQQSKIGRAVIGGLLFGNTGAIVGALSAGEKKKLKTVYIINYVTDGETKVITMKENGNPNFFKFQKRLSELLPKQELPDKITL